jgi:hypothetical protein
MSADRAGPQHHRCTREVPCRVRQIADRAAIGGQLRIPNLTLKQAAIDRPIPQRQARTVSARRPIAGVRKVDVVQTYVPRCVRPAAIVASVSCAMGHSPAREIVKFCMAQQQLDRAQILGAPIDQRRLRAMHRVGAVRCVIQSNRSDPTMNGASVLACRHVR